MLGILLVDKPQGWTSHDIVAKSRGILKTKRIGHAGTLDPLATGLLVLAVGHATRFLPYLPLEPKEYLCTVKFGESTNTFDAEGEVTSEGEVPADLVAQIESYLPEFRGEIQQLPPMFSAVKKDGKPLYVYARKGEEIERNLRDVTIHEYELLEARQNEADFRIVCSGGTYVRTLAHDLGEKIGCGAHITAIRRTRIGPFHVEEAAKIETLGEEDLWSLDQALPPLPLISLNYGQVERFQHGQPVKFREVLADRTVGLVDPEGVVIGVGQAVADWVEPVVVIPASALGTDL
ncbi:MAG: tRNA pseudouridine(55) synthase TruB [Fimbriimonadaceae bacterium]|nr:tRNA pseudouridine(55) synthase TruB [Fimbriimonadaceae bacterium]